MELGGIRYGAQIALAAAAHNIDPRLLAAVAAQESGGPGSRSGNNIVGDGGHGRGLFQIDDRTWAFARSPAAMDPAKNAEMAAAILQDNLQRFSGNVRAALSAYNSGSPTATGTKTTWSDGQTLGYADSVLRHYGELNQGEHSQLLADNREIAGGVNALASLQAGQRGIASSVSAAGYNPAAGFGPVAGFGTVAGSTGGYAPAAPQPSALPPPAVPQLPGSNAAPAAVPQGAQTQAASNVGAQADHLVADLVDSGDVFDNSADDADA